MSEKVEIKVLGSGTSQGVPVITCECDVCSSIDPKDTRLRSSILLTVRGENFVIDTGPDFRYQMLREKVKSLRGVLFTHEHKDHIAGLDDVRAFNYGEGRDMEVYCSESVEFALRREFHYVFSGVPYPGIPTLHINPIENKKFHLTNGVEVTPIQVMHYKMPVFGFRIGDFTYITDAKTVAPEEMEKVKGSKVLIVNCLHRSQHISHFNLEEALAFIEAVKPEKTYLTHISHLFGKQVDIEQSLPENVFLAYDGMCLEV